MYPGSTATAVKKYTFFGQQLLSYLDLVWTGITVKICIFLTSTPAPPLFRHWMDQRNPSHLAPLLYRETVRTVCQSNTCWCGCCFSKFSFANEADPAHRKFNSDLLHAKWLPYAQWNIPSHRCTAKRAHSAANPVVPPLPQTMKVHLSGCSMISIPNLSNPC
jgi:hypothetical protein